MMRARNTGNIFRRAVPWDPTGIGRRRSDPFPRWLFGGEGDAAEQKELSIDFIDSDR